MYGYGMYVKINGQLLNLHQNAAAYGYAENDTWKRDGVFVTFVKEGTYTALGEAVPATTIEIPNAMKDLNEITFAITSIFFVSFVSTALAFLIPANGISSH